MDSEFRLVENLLGGSRGTVGGNEVLLRKCGMGKVNAAIGAVEFIAGEAPDCIVSTGVAGGLSPELKPMDVVVAEEVVYHDAWYGEGNEFGQVQGLPARFRTDGTLQEAARAAADGTFHFGLVASGDWFVSDNAEAYAIRKHFPEALAVDMESGALAQACCLRGVPFLSIRLISDASGDDHMEEYLNFWKEVPDRSFRIIRSFLEKIPSKFR